MKMLDLVHKNLCRPMWTYFLGGSKYFITFVDDSTRWTDVEFLKSKDQAFDAFKSYKDFIENQMGKKIKCVCNRTSVKYIAERKNRTLVEMARCMMFEVDVPRSFRAEAVVTSNYLRNRYSSRSSDGEFRLETRREFHQIVYILEHLDVESSPWTSSSAKENSSNVNAKASFLDTRKYPIDIEFE